MNKSEKKSTEQGSSCPFQCLQIVEYYIKFIKDQKLCYNKRRRHRKIFNICEEKFVTLRLLGYPDWSQTNLLILSSLRQIRAMNTLEYPILYRETRGLQEYTSVFFIFGWTGWPLTSDNVFFTLQGLLVWWSGQVGQLHDLPCIDVSLSDYTFSAAIILWSGSNTNKSLCVTIFPRHSDIAWWWKHPAWQMNRAVKMYCMLLDSRARALRYIWNE